ncbi:MAG TPA: hypothetical protein VM369_04205 [Candidatus Binatia bacterium]|nr:hypothetical protein [Candidatus Binatia bacterium]
MRRLIAGALMALLPAAGECAGADAHGVLWQVCASLAYVATLAGIGVVAVRRRRGAEPASGDVRVIGCAQAPGPVAITLLVVGEDRVLVAAARQGVALTVLPRAA